MFPGHLEQVLHQLLAAEYKLQFGGGGLVPSWAHLSPSHLETRSELETEKKVELLASVATAFAKKDLPVPALVLVQEWKIKRETIVNLGVQITEFLSTASSFQ